MTSERARRNVSRRAAARVFVASVPLEGLEFARAFMALNAFPRALTHEMILIKFADDDCVALYDFLPREPRSPRVAASLLAGASVPGVVRARRLAGVPGRRCAFVAHTRRGLGFGRVGVESAVASFHERFDTNLKLRSNDCHTHVRELAQWLTCEYGERIDVDVDGSLRVVRRTNVDLEDEKEGGEEEREDAEASGERRAEDADAATLEPRTRANAKETKTGNKKQGKKKQGKK